MGLIASNNGGNFEQPPAGIFPAVCVQVIDLGTQTNEYQGETTKSRQVRIAWELQGADMLGGGATGFMSNGEPFMVTEIYTLSLNERANLRSILEGWRGRPFTEEELEGFDIANLLGKPCLVDIEHKAKQSGGTKAKVKSAKKWPAGQEAKIPVNELTYFELTDFNPDTYNGLSQWLRDKIALSPEFAAANGAPAPVAKAAVEDAPFDDEIPF